jgi:hypothetical protein
LKEIRDSLQSGFLVSIKQRNRSKGSQE